MSRREKMNKVLKLQNLSQENDVTIRGATTIGTVSPTSLQACNSPLPASATSIGVCNNG